MPSQQYKLALFVLLLCITGVLISFIFIHSNNNRLASTTLQILTQHHSEKPRYEPIPGHLLSQSISRPLVAIDNGESDDMTMQRFFEPNETTSTAAKLCAEFPDELVGPLAVTFETPSFEEIAAANPNLNPGGIFIPKNCKPRSSVAVIVPYRNRETQLRAFLHHMHPILQRQLLNYGIFVIEQSGESKFNRALLMNIGYNESLQLAKWDCFVFHDVDLFLENDRAPYSCPDGPRHMSGYIDKFEYKLPYPGIFGGISSIPKRHFEMVNGYSNLYFGWGGEDDDMYSRLSHKKFEISRYNRNIMRYKMFKHDRESTNPANERRFWLIKNAIDRMNHDGLSSLVYQRLDLKSLPTHTLVTVKVDEKALTKAVFSAV